MNNKLMTTQVQPETQAQNELPQWLLDNYTTKLITAADAHEVECFNELHGDVESYLTVRPSGFHDEEENYHVMMTMRYYYQKDMSEEDERQYKHHYQWLVDFWKCVGLPQLVYRNGCLVLTMSDGTSYPLTFGALLLKPFCLFDEASGFVYLRAWKNGKCGLLSLSDDNTIEVMIPFKYDYIYNYILNLTDHYVVVKDGKMGVYLAVSSGFELIIPCVMDQIYPSSEIDVTFFTKDGKWGWADCPKEECIRPTLIYDNVFWPNSRNPYFENHPYTFYAYSAEKGLMTF